MPRTRLETSYRNSKSVDNGFSPKIGANTAIRVANYCKYTDQNKTKFVEYAVNKVLDELEQEYINTVVETMTHEELKEFAKKRLRSDGYGYTI